MSVINTDNIVSGAAPVADVDPDTAAAYAELLSMQIDATPRFMIPFPSEIIEEPDSDAVDSDTRIIDCYSSCMIITSNRFQLYRREASRIVDKQSAEREVTIEEQLSIIKGQCEPKRCTHDHDCYSSCMIITSNRFQLYRSEASRIVDEQSADQQTAMTDAEREVAIEEQLSIIKGQCEPKCHVF